MFYTAAIISRIFLPAEYSAQVLIAGILLVFIHIIPTLVTPNAAFDESEHPHRWIINNLAAPSAGTIFGDLLAQDPIPWGIVIITQFAFLALLAHWSNGVMSRDFRWQLFISTNPEKETVARLAALRLAGRHIEADTEIKQLLAA